MMRLILSLAFVFVASAAEAADRPRVAVIVLGGAEAAALQSSLETALAAKAADLTLVPASELAARIGADDPPRDARAPFARLLEDGKAAFLDGRLEAAAAQLSQAAALADAPPADRVRANLWRANVALVAGDETAATEAVRAAFLIDPRPDVTVAEFPPAVMDRVEGLRGVMPVHVLTVARVPPGADARVDGRRLGADGTIDVAQGRHVLVVRERGFRTWQREIDVPAPATVTVPPRAMSLTAARETSLAALAHGRAPADPALAAKLAAVATLDAFVVVSAGAPIAATVWRGGRVETQSHDSSAVLAAWAADTVQRLGPRRTTENARSLRVGWTAGTSTRTLAGTGLAPVVLGGTGAAVSGEVEAGSLAAGFGAELTTFALTRMTVSVPSGSRETRGGSAFHASTWGGRAIAFSPVRTTLRLGVRLESYERALDSPDLPLFASHLWVGPEAAIDGRWSGDRVGVRATARAAYGAIYVERPAGVTGDDATLRLAPGARLELSWRATKTWNAVGVYAVDLREARFRGPTKQPLEPAVHGALVRELRQEAIFSLERSF